VHKDLALWNILGESEEIKAFIDWDDTISGDPTDDLSLIACFHSGEIVNAMLEGYTTVKDLPDNFLPRFWLHLLRNMIVKAVIRVGADYFDRESDFFLIGSGSTGASLKMFTRQRIEIACLGLVNKIKIKDL
jgi:Ser/Thr protein kinase RdoA (MazF antagonist)